MAQVMEKKAILLPSGLVRTPVFRVSYAHVWTPQSFENSDKKIYSVTAIFEKDCDFTEMLALAQRAKEKKFKNPGKAIFKSPFRKGVQKDEDHPMGFDLEQNPEYADKIIAVLKSYNRPIGVVDTDAVTVISPANGNAENFYSGCYAIADINAFAYDQQGNKGVSFGATNLMKIRDGEPLGVANVRPDLAFAGVNAADYGGEAPVDNSKMFDELGI